MFILIVVAQRTTSLAAAALFAAAGALATLQRPSRILPLVAWDEGICSEPKKVREARCGTIQ